MMEVMNMKRVAVKFNQPDQIIDFVRIMNRYEYDVDVKCGSRIVDAKSIVGVLALAKSRTVEVSGFVPILLRCMGRIPLHQRRS